MVEVFPEPIKKLPEADIPLRGLRAHLSQGPGHQVLFMEFQEDADIAEHAHAAQWSIVLEGRIDLEIEAVRYTFTKGDRIFIPGGARHSARIHAGYSDITFFDQSDRYATK